MDGDVSKLVQMKWKNGGRYSIKIPFSASNSYSAIQMFGSCFSMLNSVSLNRRLWIVS
jgi:hypothetical protein